MTHPTDSYAAGFDAGIAFNKTKVKALAQPDCRTCDNLESCSEDAKWMRNYCTNGDKYIEAPKVVLWRTEP